MTAEILIVEDNPTNFLLAKAVLESRAYRVRHAGSAAELNIRLQEKLPDLILMDVQLPGSDGLTLTRQLKSNPATARIPVIALTAFAMPDDEERALAAGCNAYITKPFRPQALLDQVTALLTPKA